jgi:hypothetical protein
MIMQMAQKGQIREDMLAPILGRKAEMADAAARMQALQNSGEMPPTVMEQIMQTNAMAEQPVMEEQPAMEDVGVAQLPVPERQYAGGGIIAFSRGSLVKDEDDDEIDPYDDYARATAMVQRANAMPVSMPTEKQSILSQIMPKSYEATLAEKGQTPASILKMAVDKPKKGDYVMPPLDVAKRGGHKYEDMVIKEAQRIGLDPSIAVHALYKETGNLKNPETAKSSAGAVGVMQLMPKTAKELGVDPLVPEDNVRGGVMYLKKMYDKYQDPTLALAAYNAGPGRLDKALKSGQGIAGLSRETQNYVVANRMASGGEVKHFNTGGVNRPFTVNSQGVARVPQYPLAIYEKPETRRIMAGADANVYPGMSDLNYYNELAAQLKEDPTYEPYKEEMAKLLKRNPSLLTATQPATNIIGPLANASNKKENAPKQDNAPKAQETPQFNYPPQGGIGPTDLELGRNAAAPVEKADKTEAKQKSPMELFLEQNAADREALGKQRSEDKNMALLAAGLGMMSGTSPYAFANIGQGGLSGVSYLSDTNRQRAAQQAALDKNQIAAMHYGNVGDYYKSQTLSKEDKLNQQKYERSMAEITRINTAIENAAKNNIAQTKGIDAIDSSKLELLIQKERARLQAIAEPQLASLYKTAGITMPNFSPAPTIGNVIRYDSKGKEIK